MPSPPTTDPVQGNMAFALRTQRVSKEDVACRVRQAAPEDGILLASSVGRAI